MLPVCSAASCCAHCQVSLKDGLRNYSQSQKAFEVRCIVGDTVASVSTNGIHFPGISLKSQVTNSLCPGSVNAFSFSSWRTDIENVGSRVSCKWNYSLGEASQRLFVSGGNLDYVAESSSSVSEEQLFNSGHKIIENPDSLLQFTNPEAASALENLPASSNAATDSNGVRSMLQSTYSEAASTFNGIPERSTTASDAFGAITDWGLGFKSNFEKFLSDMDTPIKSSVGEGGSSSTSTADKIISSINATFEDANVAVDCMVNNVLSSADQAGDLARNRMIHLSSDIKEGLSKSGYIALELLRRTIVGVENSLIEGSKFITYSYGSAKLLFPPEVQNILDVSEERAIEISRPIAMALQQVYMAVEGLERSVGLDPSDPVVPFAIFLGTSSTLWSIYWFVTYGGYAGDLSPDMALKLLSGADNVVLVDVRPEDLMERDGVPDLRRAARFRYASVSLPEVDVSVRRMMNRGRDVDDTLMALVIRNLKIVQDRSKIIIMDANGTCSKGIARSLRRLGIRRSYCLEGGFQSWVKHGLRIKELRPETAITILNEEAEAILEDLNPSPVQLFGIGLGIIAGLYALLEWEKTLQLIGVVGLGQTIYRRVASYQDSEDLKNDVRLLLAPVRLGAEAVSWATGKLETNGNGLPTSPSSSDVQNRVLQAAAIHESQPLDAAEGTEEGLSPPDSMVQRPDENVDLSQA